MTKGEWLAARECERRMCLSHSSSYDNQCSEHDELSEAVSTGTRFCHRPQNQLANMQQQEMVQVGPYPSLERTNSTTS